AGQPGRDAAVPDAAVRPAVRRVDRALGRRRDLRVPLRRRGPPEAARRKGGNPRLHDAVPVEVLDRGRGPAADPPVPRPEHRGRGDGDLRTRDRDGQAVQPAVRRRGGAARRQAGPLPGVLESPRLGGGPDMSGPVLVTGATGKTGRRLLAALRARGVPARAASRRPGEGRVHFDWTDRGTWNAA